MEQEIKNLLYEMALVMADTTEQVSDLTDLAAKSLPLERAHELHELSVNIRARGNVIRALVEQAFPQTHDRLQS